MARSSNSQKSRTSNTLFLSGIFLITIYFKQNSADPFNTPKLLVLAVLCGYLSGPLAYSYYKLRFRVEPIEFVAIFLSFFFLISQLYALINTDVFIRGFIGDTQRRNGFLQYLLVIILFLYIVRKIDIQSSLKVVKMVLWLSLIMGTYGLLQITGRDFVEWNNPYNDMISTMGNPNFASALLASFASVALISFFILNFNIPMKIVALISAGVSIYCVVMSESRQGLIIIAVTLSLFVSIMTIVRNKRLGLWVVALNIFGIFIGILGMLQIGPLKELLYKPSVSVRGYYWRASWGMFKDNLFTGVGLDSYLVNFFKYRDPGYPENYGFDISSSNAHNVILQLFATGGFFVGVSYLVFTLFVLLCGFKLIRKSEPNAKGLSVLLVVIWLGLQSQSIISIDFIALSVWTWVFAGIIVGLSNKISANPITVSNFSSTSSKTVENSKRDKSVSISITPNVISGIFLIPILILVVLLNRMEEQTYLSSAFLNSKQTKLVLDNSEKILNSNLADPYYKFKVALNLIDAGYFDKGAEVIKSLSLQDPKNSEYLKVLVRIEMTRNNLVEAAILRENMATLDPWNAQNYFELALLYKDLGRKTEMLKIKSRILDIGTSPAYSNQARIELN